MRKNIKIGFCAFGAVFAMAGCGPHGGSNPSSAMPPQSSQNDPINMVVKSRMTVVIATDGSVSFSPNSVESQLHALDVDNSIPITVTAAPNTIVTLDSS